VDHFDAILQTTSKMLEENRPRIDEITAEAAVITKAVRQQADRIGALIDDANERTRARLAQIDRTVDQTVEHVEQAATP